jgi:hypothetical protein
MRDGRITEVAPFKNTAKKTQPRHTRVWSEQSVKPDHPVHPKRPPQTTQFSAFLAVCSFRFSPGEKLYRGVFGISRS